MNDVYKCLDVWVSEKTYLAARMVSKVTPIHVEHRVIIHMQKLMHEGVFHMFFVEEISLAKHNCASIGREPARAGEVTRLARDVGRRAFYPSKFEMFEHELYRWAYTTRERM